MQGEWIHCGQYRYLLQFSVLDSNLLLKKKGPDHCVYPLTMPMCKETHCKQFYLNCWKKESKAWICEEKECLAPQTLFHEHKNKQISNIYLTIVTKYNKNYISYSHKSLGSLCFRGLAIFLDIFLYLLLAESIKKTFKLWITYSVINKSIYQITQK